MKKRKNNEVAECACLCVEVYGTAGGGMLLSFMMSGRGVVVVFGG